MSNDQIKEHLRFAQELGVAGVSRDPLWRTRRTGTTMTPAPTTEVPDPPGRPDPPAPYITADVRPLTIALTPADALVGIRTDIGDCTRCKLHKGRTQIVFGVGNPEADLMFVGEAPGRDEDLKGFPFVGRAGQLLTKIIEAIALTREDVYIANVIKCRPPENRNPEPDEVETCEPFLFRQIDIIKPKVIVALGKFGAQTLLRTLDPISRLRGRVFDYRGANWFRHFIPRTSCAILRRSAVWEDMKLSRSLLTS